MSRTIVYTTEETHIPVTRYRAEDGTPTCAVDFEAGAVCRFYATQRFGVNETCLFGDKGGKLWEPLERRNGGAGLLIPLKSCPVWADKKATA